MAGNTQNINAKSVAKYVLMPGILPRVHELVGSGFGYLAFLFASVYGTVRILPPNHPYLNPNNIGKFGILQVITTAANNLQLNRRHLDQIVVFFALLAGLVLIFLQFVLLLLAVFAGHAFAQTQGGASFQSMFVTQYPYSDIAFMMLDYVFGIPGSTGVGPNLGWFGSLALLDGPTSFHRGLHALFNFYNLAILLVGVLIFLYYIVVVVIETAQTGVPFGRRFAKLYAPFRLILAIGLLVPLNYGFNGAQYITLYAAKIGSSFATNGWLLYNDAIAGGAGNTGGGTGGTQGGNTNNPIGAPNASLVARPRTPSIDELVYFSSVYHACREMYNIWQAKDSQDPSKGTVCIRPYVVYDGQAHEFVADGGGGACGQGQGGQGQGGQGQGQGSALTYKEAKNIFKNNDMEVILGEWDTKEHASYIGGVRPYCGKITVSLSNDNPSIYSSQNTGGGGGQETGVRAVESMWYTELQTLLKNEGAFAAFGERAAHFYVPSAAQHDPCWRSGDLKGSDGGSGGGGGDCSETNWFPPAQVFVPQLNMYRAQTAALTMKHYTEFRNSLNLSIQQELRRRGWGGAGIWYNNIADLNGTFSSAIYATPTVKQFPEVMEYVKREKQTQDTKSGICTTYEPNLADNKPVAFTKTNELYIAKALNAAYKYHVCDRPAQDSSNQATGGGNTGNAGNGNNGDCADQSTSTAVRGMTNNTFINVVSLIFGINGLFDIRCNSKMDEATGMPRVHPLAQLAVVGKSLIENAIRSMAMAVGASFGGGIIGVLNQSLGAALESASGMFVSIATIGLTAGFLLYYILPFLPFMYFFFAVGSWVKSIFEAMVGVPLWALAHLHIDGDGLPGRAAMGGYFLILEIALRPIFTVFGLIGGMAVFGAMATGLNNLFDLVVVNITGAEPALESGSTLLLGSVESVRRGVIDQFFFTIMYAVLLYMLATTSFKMIDQIPQHVMRWIGSSVPIFNDDKQDPTSGLTTYTALAGNQIVPQMLDGVKTGASGLGSGLGQALKMAKGGTQAPPAGGSQG